MNKKQIIVLGIMILVTGITFWLTPRYKIVKIDADNYIKTSQRSSLYKSCKSPEQFDWPIITKILAPLVIIGPILVFLLRDKKPK